MGYYHTAQICLNGHCINDLADKYPEHSADFCSDCGAATVTSCAKCGEKILGSYHVDNVIGMFPYHVPSYCPKCGTPYPWTESALEATRALILEDEELEESQQSNLINGLPDIIAETPKSTLATTRFKKALSSAGKFTAEGLRQFVIDFGCEYAKKQLGM